MSSKLFLSIAISLFLLFALFALSPFPLCSQTVLAPKDLRSGDGFDGFMSRGFLFGPNNEICASGYDSTRSTHMLYRIKEPWKVEVVPTAADVFLNTTIDLITVTGETIWLGTDNVLFHATGRGAWKSIELSTKGIEHSPGTVSPASDTSVFLSVAEQIVARRDTIQGVVVKYIKSLGTRLDEISASSQKLLYYDTARSNFSNAVRTDDGGVLFGFARDSADAYCMVKVHPDGHSELIPAPLGMAPIMNIGRLVYSSGKAYFFNPSENRLQRPFMVVYDEATGTTTMTEFPEISYVTSALVVNGTIVGGCNKGLIVIKDGNVRIITPENPVYPNFWFGVTGVMRYDASTIIGFSRYGLVVATLSELGVTSVTEPEPGILLQGAGDYAIDINGMQNVSWTLVNSQGEMVKGRNGETAKQGDASDMATQLHVDTDDLANGMYCLTVYSDGKPVLRRVLMRTE